MVVSDGNTRFDWLKKDIDYIKRKLDELAGCHAATSATVRSHGAAIKWLYGIVASLIMLLVVYAAGLR